MMHWMGLLIAIAVGTRSTIQDEKDRINNFLRLLPAKLTKIVAAKFVFLNAVYIFSSIIIVIYLSLLASARPAVISINIELQLISLSLSLIIINLYLFGYYLFGAKNLQYALSISAFFSVFTTKYLLKLIVMPYAVVVLVIAVLACVFLYLLTCWIFKNGVTFQNY